MMKTNILTLCDFAKDYNGQLNISGTFNQIRSSVFPSEPISFFIAMQFVFKDEIVGQHRISISVVNKTTGEDFLPTQELRLDIAKKNDGTEEIPVMPSFILAVDKIVFESPGAFVVKVVTDDYEQEIEFFVVKA